MEEGGLLREVQALGCRPGTLDSNLMVVRSQSCGRCLSSPGVSCAQGSELAVHCRVSGRGPVSRQLEGPGITQWERKTPWDKEPMSEQPRGLRKA